jgi:voltage-gated potassium channel
MAERTNSREPAERPARRRPQNLEGQLQERFRERAARAISSRHIFRYLAAATALLSFGAGVLVWLIDRKDFPTLGDALWWALVTLATVGYGDIVPQSAWGRVVGSFVIVLGVTFLSLLTATVTSYFVEADQERRLDEATSLRGETDDDLRDELAEVRARLEAIEELLRDLARPR